MSHMAAAILSTYQLEGGFAIAGKAPRKDSMAGVFRVVNHVLKAAYKLEAIFVQHVQVNDDQGPP